MLEIREPVSNYLEFSYYINWKHPKIIRIAADLIGNDELETTKKIYYFVRDHIKHS